MQIVYKLNNLTPEEIKIVEGKNETADWDMWDGHAGRIKLINLFFFTQRKFNGLITRYGCGHSGIGKEIRKI